ncbi:MAG: PAS domain-containing protein [Candidatus Hydrogenedentes bacterium]|nr:PAS domain-containing protein [Candidatus Hydrogenedentota bacterium]
MTLAIGVLLGCSLLCNVRQHARARRMREEAGCAAEDAAAERAELERRLAEGEERFEWFAEHTENVVFRMAVPAGNHIYLNRAAIAYYECSREELFSNPASALQVLHPDHHQEFFRQWEGIVSGRGCTPTEKEFRAFTKDGDIRWMKPHVRVVNDAQGRPAALEGLVRDVTEQRRTAHALRDTEEHLRRAQEVARIGSWHYDLGTERLRCSAKTFQITGYAEGTDVTPQHMLDLTHPEDRERVDAAWAAALTGVPLDTEFRILTADRKETRWVYNRSEAESDGDGACVAVTGVLQDITERKQLELQLLQAQKMEAVGLLAGGIAHDFNNVLGVILGYAELAADRCGEGRDPRPEIGQILDATARARRLVRQIAAFNRRTATRHRPVSLNREIADVGEVWRRILPRSIRLEFRLADGLWPVSADPNQIDQILMNLANNAVDAMRGSGCLSVTTENTVRGGQACPCCGVPLQGEWVRVSVSDTGCGMAPEQMGRIFESFYTTRAEGQGTGLGLYMAREIVTDHGGHIFCRSAPGEGARFEILLPALPAQSLPEPQPKPVPDALRRGGETLLLVEDEPELLAINTAFLESGGYAVLTARDSEEALALYAEKGRETAAVVSNLNMPGMPPAQYISRLRAVNPGLRLLIVSGYFTAGQACGGDPGPGTWFLGKPYGREDLLRMVAVMLGDGPGTGGHGG